MTQTIGKMHRQNQADQTHTYVMAHLLVAKGLTQANYRAWVLSELGTQTIPYAMSDQS